MPVAVGEESGRKRKADLGDEGEHTTKAAKLEYSPEQESISQHIGSPEKWQSPNKPTPTKKTRSATSNADISKKPSPVKADGSKRITSFFGKT